MTPHDLHTILRADARRWPDHSDYWRFGPTTCPLTLPATLPKAGTVYTGPTIWVGAALLLLAAACATTPRTIPGVVDRIEQPAGIAVVETVCTTTNDLPCVFVDVPVSQLPPDVKEGQTVEVPQ